MWDIEAYPMGDFGFSWFFFYNNDVPGWSQDQLKVSGHFPFATENTVSRGPAWTVQVLRI